MGSAAYQQFFFAGLARDNLTIGKTPRANQDSRCRAYDKPIRGRSLQPQKATRSRTLRSVSTEKPLSNRAPRRRSRNQRGRQAQGHGLARPRLSLGRQNPPPLL